MIEKETSNKFLLWSCALFPIFGEYELKLIPISLGQIVMMFCILWKLVLRQRPTFNRKIIIMGFALAAYNFLPGLLLYDSISNTVNNSISILLTFILLSFAFEKDIRLEVFYSYIKICGIVVTVFLFVQAFLHFKYNVNIHGRLSFLDSIFKCDNDLVFIWIDTGHPCSFFYEPAHYSIYMAPIFMLSLLFKDYWLSIVCSVGMFVSTSSTGYAVVVLSIALFVFCSVKTNYKLALIPIMCVALWFLIVYSGVDLSKFQFENINSNIRVFGTLQYFESFSFSDWLIGVGFNRLVEWGNIRGVINRGYANSFFFMIFSYGVFGLFVCIYLIRSLVKRKTWKPIAILVIALLFSDQMCFNRNFFYLIFIALLCAGYNIDTNNKMISDENRSIKQ